MMMYFLNCNSLNNKIGEIKDLLIKNTPDIFCLCETWLNPKYVPKFNNYISEWQHRCAAGGGIGIFIHKEMQTIGNHKLPTGCPGSDGNKSICEKLCPNKPNKYLQSKQKYGNRRNRTLHKPNRRQVHYIGRL